MGIWFNRSIESHLIWLLVFFYVCCHWLLLSTMCFLRVFFQLRSHAARHCFQSILISGQYGCVHYLLVIHRVTRWPAAKWNGSVAHRGTHTDTGGGKNKLTLSLLIEWRNAPRKRWQTRANGGGQYERNNMVCDRTQEVLGKNYQRK